MKNTTRITLFMSCMMLVSITISLCVGVAGGILLDRDVLNHPAGVAQVTRLTPSLIVMPSIVAPTLTPSRVPPTETATPVPTLTPTAIPSPTLMETLPVISGQGLDQSLIDQAWRDIQQKYVDRSAISGQDLTYGAITGMVEALGDTGHSVFLTAAEARAENGSLNGAYEGIGAYVDSKNGQTVIVSPIDGSPAQKAGLLPGDIIVKVDGKDVSGMTLTQVVNLVLGPAGTQVTLTILTPSTNLEREVTLTRAKIVIASVSWVAIPGTKIAHLRIVQFSKGSGDALKKALQQIKAQNMTGIILDLRNNPGGLVDEVIKATSEFLKSGDVYLEKDAAGNVQHIPVVGKGTATEIPMVVLINSGSASASEILAGAIQDYGRAKLIGEPTFGTGTVLNEFPLKDGSVLVLAVKEWLTPNGRVIWHKGIQPDQEVKLDLNVIPLTPDNERTLSAAELQASKDKQLLTAIEVLKTP